METEFFSKKGLILGLGDIFRGDEGFACYLLENLACLPFGRAIQLAYLGNDPRYAGGLIYGSTLVIIVGAFRLGGAPGKLYTWPYGVLEEHAVWAGNENGSLRFLTQVLTMMKMAGELPKQVSFLWTEPRTTEGYGLSHEMRKPMLKAVRNIKQQLFEYGLLPEKALSVCPILHMDPRGAIRSKTTRAGKKPQDREALEHKAHPFLHFEEDTNRP